MGKKTNPIIFRLGKTKEWNTKYIEKKTIESSTLIVRDLEIQKFIYQLFLQNKLYVQNCKTYFSENSTHIYVLYYNSENLYPANNKLFKTKPTKNVSNYFKNKTSAVTKIASKKNFYSKKIYGKNLKQDLLQKQYFLQKKSQRLKPIQTFKNYVTSVNQKFSSNQNLNFIFKALKSISLFTQKNQDIFFYLKQINNETTFLQNVTGKKKLKIRENAIKFRRFQQNSFFKLGFNILYNSLLENQNPRLLANFIASNLKKLKRPNFFLRFIKVALKMFLTKKFSNTERIQIKISGRLNGMPRSSHKFINVGKKVPILTLNSNVTYGESTAYTSNGTIGVKIWSYMST